MATQILGCVNITQIILLRKQHFIAHSVRFTTGEMPCFVFRYKKNILRKEVKTHMKVKHKFLNVLLAVCMVFSMVPATVFAAENVSIPDTVWTDYAATSFAGGNGSEADPYQIATAEQLAKLSKDVQNGNMYRNNFFKLTADIDLGEHRWVPIGIYKWESSGDVTNKMFLGFIDGNNKTISNLTIDERTDKNAAGFFGNIRNPYGDTVGAKDLTISNANIYADENGLSELQAGILAGYVLANEDYQVVFENITVSGTVKITSTSGNNNVGGMIGYGSRVKATDCKAENISVTGASNSGGFIGVDVGSAYENCEVCGKVSGLWGLGGFVGYTSTATDDDPITQSVFKKCAADVEIEGSDWNLGGFAGYAEYGQFDNCVAFGDVTSTVTNWEPHVGGFFGESDVAIANNCHAAGEVTSAHSYYKAGGFVGCYYGGTFTDCSFDSDKNSGLAADGMGTTLSGVEADNSNNVLTNICADYYGGHNYSTEWTIDTEANCTTNGSKSHHCIRCSHQTDITPIQAEGHDLKKIKAKTATCTEDGYEAYWTCENCGKLFSDEAGETEIDTPVTITKTGHTYEDELTFDETGHWYATTCGHDNVAGALDIQPHTFGDWTVTKEATEDATGLKERSCVCGYKETVEIGKLAHTTHVKDNGTRVEPTCENKGSITYKCTECGEVMEVVELDALGHNYTSQVTTEPTTENKPDTGKPFIKGETGKEGWDIIKDKVGKTKDGDTVTVEMNGSAVVPGNVMDEIKGKGTTIVFDMGNGITWSVNGQSITSDKIGDIDFSVKVGTNTIPVDAINNVTGERYSQQISLAYDGEFGFTAVLSINMEASNAGLYANLFYYNEKTGELEFICADEIAADGTAELTFTHASDYAIVIDKEPMEGSVQVDRPASESQSTEAESTQTGAEVSNDAWNPWWIIVIGIMVIVIGLGVFLVAKKKKEDELE